MTTIKSPSSDRSAPPVSGPLAPALRRCLKILAVVAVAAAYAPLACVGVDDDTEQQQSALGAFGSWLTLSRLNGDDAPALARSGSTTMTAYGNSGTAGALGFHQVVEAHQDASGNWNAWTQLSNNGGSFSERPAATGFKVSSGPLVDRYLLVARRPDNKYYVRIQNQTGSSILQDWTAIAGTWTSAPAITFVPLESLTAPLATLVLFGRGLDNRYYEMRNPLLRNPATGALEYVHSRWVPPAPRFGAATFSSPPALAFGCPATHGAPSLIVAGAIGSSFVVSGFDGSTWGSLFFPNGTFISGTGPALAVGCGTGGHEVTLYGRGQDSRIWAGVVVLGTSFGFAPVGTDTFGGSPTATGFDNTVTVAASNGTLAPFQSRFNTASSP